MFKSSLFKRAFLLIVLIVLLFVVDTKIYLSWFWWWFDDVMHFLGGVWISMVALLLWQEYILLVGKRYEKSQVFLVSIVTVVVVGILWEAFELAIGQTFLSDGLQYLLDTSSDFIFDLSGGVLGALYSIRVLAKKELPQ